jgi:ActR/RegA family two-component response regulator
MWTSQKAGNVYLISAHLALLPRGVSSSKTILRDFAMAFVLLTPESMTTGRILILEDDPDVASVYEKALREDGNSVTVCSRFEDAREQLRREPPDAVLTDVRVGQYNGLQLAILFRRQSPDGRIVVVTGYDDTVIRKEVKELHAEFLLKPIRVAQLKGAFCAPDKRPFSARH